MEFPSEEYLEFIRKAKLDLLRQYDNSHNMCKFEDSAMIGKLKSVRIMNTGIKVWRFERLDVKINGISQGTWQGSRKLKGSQTR